jgi:hypothetical protein
LCPDTIVELPGVLQQLVLSNVVWLSAKYAMAIDEQEMMRVNWDNRTTEELSGGVVCLRHASVRQAVTWETERELATSTVILQYSPLLN